MILIAPFVENFQIHSVMLKINYLRDKYIHVSEKYCKKIGCLQIFLCLLSTPFRVFLIFSCFSMNVFPFFRAFLTGLWIWVGVLVLLTSLYIIQVLPFSLSILFCLAVFALFFWQFVCMYLYISKLCFVMYIRNLYLLSFILYIFLRTFLEDICVFSDRT